MTSVSESQATRCGLRVSTALPQSSGPSADPCAERDAAYLHQVRGGVREAGVYEAHSARRTDLW